MFVPKRFFCRKTAKNCVLPILRIFAIYMLENKSNVKSLYGTTMLLRFIVFLFLLSPTAFAEDRLAEFYQRAIPAVERFLLSFDQTGPTNDFTIFTIFNNIAIFVSANADKPVELRPDMEIVMKLLRLAETMQDRNLESRTFGNFRWNWSQTGVTDPNAAEFAVARMLSIYLDTPKPLSDEARNILLELLEYAVHPCMNRRIPPDYTNIAFYNATHLILLGQVLDCPEVSQEGKRRLKNIVAHIWSHGLFEYNSPAYYFINVDSLQLAYRHVNDEETKQMIHVLLEFFWTDMSLHWYSPGLRLAGAQSRTYNYLYGINVHKFRLFAFAGIAPYDHDARYHAVLLSFRAQYQPPPEIAALVDLYPRWVTRTWGRNQGQWAAMYMFEDIVLGTAGAKYDAQQNMVQVIDMPDYETANDSRRMAKEQRFTPQTWQLSPRSYFIADGREDPYGTKLYETGSGGQQKPLHLDALWYGSQRTVDSLGIALYPPEVLADPVVINVQSHFVVRKPLSIWLGDEQITLSPHQPLDVGGAPIVFRYKTSAFGIRAVWTRDQAGQPADVFLIDDENEHGVYRLTIEHIPQRAGDCVAVSGAAFWVRIGSSLSSGAQFSAWRQRFISAAVNRLEVEQNDIEIEVAGQDGIVAVKLADSVVGTIPAAPTGILSLDGKDLGRPILERIPAAARFVQRRDAAEPIMIEPSGTYWEAESGYSFFEDWIEPDESASGGFAARVNQDVSWQLRVRQSGEYFLWGRVLTIDAQHDSFFVEVVPREQAAVPPHRKPIAWHLGVRSDWTWVRLPVPIRLEEGVWQLTLKPREFGGRIDQLFLTWEAGDIQ